MRIGVAIPCYKFHIPQLKRCLDSIEAQTVKPDMVVVSCSSVGPGDIPSHTYKYSFPLRIIGHKERKNAAQNRNVAAAALDTDIVSFFDCDDEMHPQRIEAIKEAFTNDFSLDIVLHSFLMNEETEKPFEPIPKFSMQPQCLSRSPTGCAIYIHNWSERIHHSQVTVSRFVLGRIQFKEDESNERREDALFCGDVLAMPNCQNMYIFDPLSKYYMEGVTHPILS
jgi:glycosyltransferase involved in cell wall biosynthesis